MRIITSLSHFSTIHLGDTIRHPVFGDLRVDLISKFQEKNEEEYQIACSLVEFNNTLKIFDGMDLIRIKYGRRTILRVVK
jgi:hypothetical protein